MKDGTVPRLSLRVRPRQILRYESVSLSCEDSANTPGDWIILRKTSRKPREKCEVWGETKGSECVIEYVDFPDSGQYWCEKHGRSSEPVNITVTAVPVTPPPPSSLPLLSAVPSSSPPSSSSGLLLPLLCSTVPLLLLFLLVLILLKWKRHRSTLTPEVKEEEGGTDDTTYSHLLHQQQQPIRVTESDPSPVYSAVKAQDVLYSHVTIRDDVRSALRGETSGPEVVYSAVNPQSKDHEEKRRKEKKKPRGGAEF